MGSRKGDGHSFKARDLEQKALALCGVCVAADGADGALEERFTRG